MTGERSEPRTAAGKRLHDDYPGIWFWEWEPRDGGVAPFWDGPLGPSIEAEAASLDRDELRKALARAITEGYTDASVDPALYQSDPVYHAVVWEIRKVRALLSAGDKAEPCTCFSGAPADGDLSIDTTPLGEHMSWCRLAGDKAEAPLHE